MCVNVGIVILVKQLDATQIKAICFISLAPVRHDYCVTYIYRQDFNVICRPEERRGQQVSCRVSSSQKHTILIEHRDH